MNLKEQVEKIVGNRYGAWPPKVSDTEYNRIMRQLMLRLIDVEEMFPGEYDYYEDIKDEYLPDFLRFEDNRDYSYSLELSRSGGYKLVITDWSTDYRQDTVIKIPLFILEDKWYNDVESQISHRRINEINKEIDRIKEIMASGNEKIEKLMKEKTELEDKLNNLNTNGK